ncbi:MAG TPA: hypothetical protein VFP84_02820 [Kofleriaceae bacterium]|nr:hypothetical protein [Kofleriaceae bacterium]
MTDDPRREPRDAPPEVAIGDVPRLPRGRGLRLSGPQLFRIVATLALLVFVIVAQKPCAHSVSKFVTSFGSGSAATMPTPGTVDVPTGSAAGSATRPETLDGYERLHPGMTDDEIKATIDRARARAGQSNGSGSGSAAR